MKNLRPDRFFTWIVATFSALDRASGDDLTSQKVEVNHGELLIQWLHSRGGFVNQKIEIRRANPSEPTSRFGLFAKEELAKKERILEVPRNMFITGEPDEDEDHEINCSLVRNLIREMRLGNDSEFAPWVNYLVAEPSEQLPSAWSDEGKRLLRTILEKHTIDLNPLRPIDPVGWDEAWYNECGGSRDDPFALNAALITQQRGYNRILIPLFDIMNHRNGDWLNTENNSIDGDVKFAKVRATRTIEAGEEIHTTFNLCKECGDRVDDYGTGEILRDYGFLEKYPQRWFFYEEISLEIDEWDDGLELSWIEYEDKSSNVGARLLFKIKSAMESVGDTVLQSAKDDGIIPKNELATIVNFHKALTDAVSVATEVLLNENADVECSEDKESCSVALTRYDDLTEDTPDLAYEFSVCDNEDFYNFEGYDLIEEIQSAYQFVSIKHNPTTTDTCLQLEDTVQICDSYRPHYHEMVVHYTARYVEKVQRVLFVGGGDSLLLHEILKYPDLELVVGLELDQVVTRTAFKHFGSQPHWDNDKVEWWYGNACKSLLMLPKNYFGSFDMVLVDLSETVMSFKVTSELDIMHALALLLKPDGIMVKNELYFKEMADIFVETSQIHYRDVPVICSQNLILGSNRMDFLKQPLTDHNIDSKNVLLWLLNVDEHNDIIHDYAYVPDNLQKHCDYDNVPDNFQKTNEKGSQPKTQEESPGIIMITEAEDASAVLFPLSNVNDLIVQALDNNGFSVFSTILPNSDNLDPIMVAILKEGYVVTKCWPTHKYCSFDIHLWSSFDKQKNLSNSLVSAVGSSSVSSSSYRVVAGGMFGVSTWEGDDDGRGPQRTIPCSLLGKTPPSNISMGESENPIDVIIEESIKYARDENNIVTIICGQIESQPCASYDALRANDNLSEKVVIWTCSDLDEYSENYAQKVYACELAVQKKLKTSLSRGKKISAIVIDSAVSYTMGQILFKVVTSISSMEIFTDDTKVIAISLDEKDVWRSNFANRFRKEVLVMEPTFKGSVAFNNSDISIELNIASKEEDFISNLNEIISRIEGRTDIVSKIIDVAGGQLKISPDYEFSQITTASDYDQISPFKQWSSQQQLEQQNIFQLEGSDDTALSAPQLKKAFEQVVNSVKSPTNDAKIDEFSELGDGTVLVAFWSGTRVILVWDGRSHIDINLCMAAVNKTSADSFKRDFITLIPSLKVVLQDEQPRGFGRVVNFLQDTQSDFLPAWAQ